MTSELARGTYQRRSFNLGTRQRWPLFQCAADLYFFKTLHHEIIPRAMSNDIGWSDIHLDPGEAKGAPQGFIGNYFQQPCCLVPFRLVQDMKYWIYLHV